MMARSTTLQQKAGYIDARPPTTSSSKSSCYDIMVDSVSRDIFESKLGDKAEDFGIVGSNMPYVRSYIVRSSRINASITRSRYGVVSHDYLIGEALPKFHKKSMPSPAVQQSENFVSRPENQYSESKDIL